MIQVNKGTVKIEGSGKQILAEAILAVHFVTEKMIETGISKDYAIAVVMSSVQHALELIEKSKDEPTK